MIWQVITEIVGAIAAAGVLLSYLFTNQKRLRIVNLVACIIFVIYGFCLAALSGWINGWVTVIMNASCAVVHIVYLVRNKKRREKEADEYVQKRIEEMKNVSED